MSQSNGTANRNFSPGWKIVIRKKYIPVNLEDQELQIKTSSSLDSNKAIMVRLYTSIDSGAGNIWIYFRTKMEYHLGYCTENGDFDTFNIAPNIKTPTIWRITKDEDTKLLIWCNDELVLSYTFKSSSKSGCVGRYALDAARVQFNEGLDTASDLYRIVSASGQILNSR